jgi:hypothetical protein
VGIDLLNEPLLIIVIFCNSFVVLKEFGEITLDAVDITDEVAFETAVSILEANCSPELMVLDISWLTVDNIDAVAFDRYVSNWDAYCSPVEVMLDAVAVIEDVAFEKRFSICVVNPRLVPSALTILWFDWSSCGRLESEIQS